MPMSDSELNIYLERLCLSPAALDYVHTTRTSEPSRNVCARRRNVIHRYPSRKMGFVVALESTEEYEFAVSLEHACNVTEYWEQPPQVKLTSRNKKGHTVRVPYTPDFLVLFDDEVCVVQVKPLTDCIELAKTTPWRWSCDGTSASDIAAAAHFEALGLKHVVHVSDPSGRLRTENMELMLKLREAEFSEQAARLVARGLLTIAPDEIISAAKLCSRSGTQDATIVPRLVDRGLLHTDLGRCRLASPEQCVVSKSADAIRAHFEAQDAIAREFPAVGNLCDDSAIAVHARLKTLNGEEAPMQSLRTRQRWRRALHAAKGNLAALSPRHRNKGNRKARLSLEEEEVMRSSIEAHYLTSLVMSKLAAWGAYLVRHQDAVSSGKLLAPSCPVSYTTYAKRCRSVKEETAAMARSGRRAASAAANPVPRELAHLVPVRFLQRAHVDHYVTDINVIVSRGRTAICRRPWLTAMRDEAYGNIIAVSLSFLPPSCLSVMSVIRDCVRRHGRLPEALVVDNGSEFHSSHFELILAHYGVTKVSRPPEAPRFGGTIEAWFHTFKSFLGKLPGNRSNDEKMRAASSTHKSVAQASLSIVDLYNALEAFVFTHYNHAHEAGSPDSRFLNAEASVLAFPDSGISVGFSERFLAATALPLKRQLSIDSARGVRHLDRWFSHPSLFKATLEGQRVTAYEEPWDSNRIYVNLNDERIICRHGSATSPNLCVDFAPALESIRLLECPSARTERFKNRVAEEARIAESARSRAATESTPVPIEPPKPSAKKALVNPDPLPINVEPYEWRRK